MEISVDALDFTSVKPGSLIDVETRSRHYQIEFLGGDSIRISGHPEYCPQPVEARLEGSLNREGGLDYGLIECGLRMLFIIGDHLPVRTSKVLHVHSAGN